jgi:hypothetical protein
MTDKCRYHVRYYYLATGMEGKPDERDFGERIAETAHAACEQVADELSKGPDDKAWIMGCLSARRVS